MSKIVEDRKARGEAPPDRDSPEWGALVVQIRKERGYVTCDGRNTMKWPCEAKRLASRKYCGKHGGRAARGVDAPGFKHGRYSKVLEGTSLSDAYEAARKDPELLTLNEDISANVARLQELFQKLPRGEGKVAWETACNQLAQLEDAVKRGADGEVETKLKQLRTLFEEGLSEYYTWQHITSVQTHLRKMIDTERKYREGMGFMVPVERVQVWQSMWLEAIKRRVPKELIAPVMEEMRQLREANSFASGSGHIARTVVPGVHKGREVASV